MITIPGERIVLTVNANTSLGGANGSFPATRWTLIRSAGEAHGSALECFAKTYWRPVYAYLRAKWGKSNDEAKDLTQDFFEALCEKSFLDRLSPERGRFRAYVMTALDNLVRLDWRDEHRKKRGGAAVRVPLENVEPVAGDSPESVFLREWARSVVDGALREMESDYVSRGKSADFELFRLHELDRPPGEDLGYEALARRFRVDESDIKNILYGARVLFRRKVREAIADTASTPEEAEREFRELFEGGARW